MVSSAAGNAVAPSASVGLGVYGEGGGAAVERGRGVMRGQAWEIHAHRCRGDTRCDARQTKKRQTEGEQQGRGGGKQGGGDRRPLHIYLGKTHKGEGKLVWLVRYQEKAREI